jgi:hypothetical protein
VCCQVEVSASDRSLFQRRPTECGVSECDREASVMRMPWPTRGCWALGKGKSGIVNNKQFTLPAFEHCGLAITHTNNGTCAA